MITRRTFLKGGLAAGTALLLPSWIAGAAAAEFESRRPAPGDRKFTSEAVEETIRRARARIADPELAWLFENCFPNTLDTTVHYREIDGKPDTFVITGDIDAMWLRDSSAQIWPYLALTRRDEALRKLVQGVIRRQARCILLDPYANAFLEDPDRVSEWRSDYTVMRPGVHEHKWEVDSLCYPVRLAHGYWKRTGDAVPFDSEWEQAMGAVVRTFREQQRKDGHGPYYFKRGGDAPDLSDPRAYGKPVKPVGLIYSAFRPSDDRTVYPFLIPSNFFAAVSLRQMAEMLGKIRHNHALASEADALAHDVEQALKQYALVPHEKYGAIYAYEIDGLGNTLLMDDANVPNLLSLPYLGAKKTGDRAYQATRRFAWSPDNPWFFQGKYSGIGGPHVGKDMIWPISLIMYGLTGESASESRSSLAALKATHAGTGFMHESFNKDDPNRYTRSWFAWANTLFGEFVLDTLQRFPEILRETL